MQKSSSPSFDKKEKPGSWRLGAPHLVAIIAVAVFVAGGYLLRDRLTELPAVLESPESQIKRALAAQTRASLSDVYGFKSGGTVELTRVEYRAPVIAPEPDHALVTAMLD